jgi:hypothetical protein
MGEGHNFVEKAGPQRVGEGEPAPAERSPFGLGPFAGRIFAGNHETRAAKGAAAFWGTIR